MNRRGFLGVLGIGAAAAPVIAKELAQVKPVTPSEPVVGYPNKDGYDICTLGYEPMVSYSYYAACAVTAGYALADDHVEMMKKCIRRTWPKL